MGTLQSVQGLTFWQALRAPVTVRRGLKVGLVVGTILTLINHGDTLLAGAVPPLWKLVLTYCVPYSVSSYSTAAFIREMGQDD
ncbi:MAG: nitrate/nitrite transporter NrtS [Pseudomonadota bacterium]